MNDLAPIAAPQLLSAYDQLKPTERAFVDAYVATDDPRGAALFAVRNQQRYANTEPNTAPAVRAREFMSRPLIQAAIVEKMRAVMDRLDIRADRVLAEIATVAFANMGEYTRITEKGDIVVDFSGVNSDQMAAVSEITTEVYSEGRGDDALDVKRTKFKLHSKLDALDKLARYHGLYEKDNHRTIDTRNLNLNVNTEMSVADAADLYARQLEQSKQ